MTEGYSNMAESIELSTTLPATAENVYHAWMDSAKHSDMTGDKAEIIAETGAAFTAWNGYISGKTIELVPFRRIVQQWRTTEFPEKSEDSILEILLEDVDSGVRLTLIHSEIPDGQSKNYEDGWRKYYFQPMRQYFSR